jgi:hypothetical protein
MPSSAFTESQAKHSTIVLVNSFFNIVVFLKLGLCKLNKKAPLGGLYFDKLMNNGM